LPPLMAWSAACCSFSAASWSCWVRTRGDRAQVAHEGAGTAVAARPAHLPRTWTAAQLQAARRGSRPRCAARNPGPGSAPAHLPHVPGHRRLLHQRLRALLPRRQLSAAGRPVAALLPLRVLQARQSSMRPCELQARGCGRAVAGARQVGKLAASRPGCA
jgi:hypothetical protein